MQIQLPSFIELVEGNLTTSFGNLSDNETTEYTIKVKLSEKGVGKIEALIIGFQGEQVFIGSSFQYISISDKEVKTSLEPL